MAKSGWYKESARHSLAAKGVPTGRKMNPIIVKPSYLNRKINFDDFFTIAQLKWETQGNSSELDERQVKAVYLAVKDMIDQKKFAEAAQESNEEGYRGFEELKEYQR